MAVAALRPAASVETTIRSPVTRVTVTGAVDRFAAASLPVTGLVSGAPPLGCAVDGPTAVTARATAVAAPHAVRDIGRIALPR
ncbi:hypothetical protein GCM10010371_13030 [Streptomyces subrutilus]|uniref:Uncharacterized protein n=1 Tax=Streptomyces subrutilus TaxID=36818 RepID=A0A918QM97_9ACTN|nr:hypothetical protein GCM10010371_13030 [Streptomyces subrutilus]